MQIDRPLLTIAIPTWNRAVFLDRLLSVLLNELCDQPEVELLVSDNASPDNTGELVEQYRQRGLRLRYLRNESNLGPDANILKCYVQASGKYVWILSDDDLPMPGAITRIVESLSQEEYELVCLGHYSFHGKYVGHKEFKKRPDIVFTSADSLARRIHVFFTFISIIIVNKERVSNVTHSPFEALIGSNLAQLGPYFAALNHHRKSLLIQDPILAAQGNTQVSYALYRVFGTTLSRIVLDRIDSKPVQEAILGGTLRRFLPVWIMSSRASNISREDEDAHCVLRPCFGHDIRYWLFDYPIYALPLPLARFWMFGVRCVNKVDSNLHRMLEGL